MRRADNLELGTRRADNLVADTRSLRAADTGPVLAVQPLAADLWAQPAALGQVQVALSQLVADSVAEPQPTLR
jgi:hypothetical protein